LINPFIRKGQPTINIIVSRKTIASGRHHGLKDGRKIDQLTECYHQRHKQLPRPSHAPEVV
jgi:hypothetical protein